MTSYIPVLTTEGLLMLKGTSLLFIDFENFLLNNSLMYSSCIFFVLFVVMKIFDLFTLPLAHLLPSALARGL